MSNDITKGRLRAGLAKIIQPNKDPDQRERSMSQQLENKAKEQMARSQKALAGRKLNTVIRTVDRVLSPMVDQVLIVEDPGTTVPGWTDGVNVTLNASRLPQLENISARDLAAWLGVNAHEVGHTLFSPREDSVLIKKIRDLEKAGMYQGMARVESLAEDQRMERLTIGRHRKWVVYLTAAASHFIIEPKDSQIPLGAVKPEAGALPDRFDEMWPWIAGRTWLPADLRQQARDAWAGDGRRLGKLMGRYQMLADPGYEDVVEALELLTQMRECLLDSGLYQFGDELPRGCSNQHGSESELNNDEDPITNADPDDTGYPSGGSDEDEESLDEAAPESGTGVPKDEGEDEGDGEGEEDGEEDGESDGSGSDEDASDSQDQGGGDSDTGGDPSDPGEGGSDGNEADSGDQSDQSKGTGQGEGTGGQGDNQDNQDNQDQQDHGAGTKSSQAPGKGAGTSPSEIAKRITEHVSQQIDNRLDVSNDLARYKEALEGGKHETEIKARERGKFGAPPDDVVSAGIGVSREMRRLVDKALPYHERRVDNGRLNVGRYMRRQPFDPLDTMFDRFEQGMQDDISLDVTVLLDLSSSMGTQPRYRDAGGGHPDSDFRPWDLSNDVVLELPPLVALASEAVWAIRHATEEAEGECTVLGYNTESMTLAPTGTPAPKGVEYYQARGGTDPRRALKDTWARLQFSEAAHKVVVCVTDGAWSGGGETVRGLSMMGVTTIGVVLAPGYSWPLVGRLGQDRVSNRQNWIRERGTWESLIMGMGTTHNAIVDNPLDMVDLFKKVVAEELESAMDEDWSKGVMV